LLSFGFIQSKVDYSLFAKKDNQGVTVVLVYVDDMLITGSNLNHINQLKELLHFVFHMKDLGEFRHLLGIEVVRSGKGIFLSQRKYMLDLLHETNMINAKPFNLPTEEY